MAARFHSLKSQIAAFCRGRIIKSTTASRLVTSVIVAAESNDLSAPSWIPTRQLRSNMEESLSLLARQKFRECSMRNEWCSEAAIGVARDYAFFGVQSCPARRPLETMRVGVVNIT